MIAEGVLITERITTKLDNEIKERDPPANFPMRKSAAGSFGRRTGLEVTGTLPQLDDEVLAAGKISHRRHGEQDVAARPRARSAAHHFRRRHRRSEGRRLSPDAKAFHRISEAGFQFAIWRNRPFLVSRAVSRPTESGRFSNCSSSISFIPAWNQLVTNIRYVCAGVHLAQWKCPLVILCALWRLSAGGSLWHSQANESALAHYPGISTSSIPSTPEDAAGLFWTAMHCEDPTLFLIPKHCFGRNANAQSRSARFRWERRANGSTGSDLTLIAWGNTVEKSLEALAQIGERIEHRTDRSAFDRRRGTTTAIEESVRKTGRLVVVQEDTENCSVGQMIITHIASQY